MKLIKLSNWSKVYRKTNSKLAAQDIVDPFHAAFKMIRIMSQMRSLLVDLQHEIKPNNTRIKNKVF